LWIVCFQLGFLTNKQDYLMQRADEKWFSCFQHFFLNNSVTLDIIELIFGNGCPNAIFEHVFEKKEEQIR
jgi:hypothetical protein